MQPRKKRKTRKGKQRTSRSRSSSAARRAVTSETIERLIRDEQINAYALPILVQATLDSQSANIDMVSGATYTSSGYLQSLQAALDEARP